MSPKQNAVMWLGLLLIILRLFTTSQWKDIWSTILKGSGNSGGGLNLPNLGPLLPGPLGQLPLSSNTNPNSGSASV